MGEFQGATTLRNPVVAFHNTTLSNANLSQSIIPRGILEEKDGAGKSEMSN